MSSRRTPALGLAAAALTLALAAGGLAASAARGPDEAGVYEVDGWYAKSPGEYNAASARNLARKVDEVRELWLGEAGPVYFALIPDKNYALRDSGRLDFDYGGLEETLRAGLPDGVAWIGLSDALTLADYYKTDVHWRQDRLQGVLDALGAAMGFSVSPDGWTAERYAPFRGAYARYREEMPAEELVYLASPVTQQAQVRRFGEADASPVYQTELLAGETPYNVFLGGVSPVITVDSPAAASERELVIFGDSFANSLVPLLLGEYRRVTLADLRFLAAALVGDYLDCAGAEVLFLYSLPVANDSCLLK